MDNPLILLHPKLYVQVLLISSYWNFVRMYNNYFSYSTDNKHAFLTITFIFTGRKHFCEHTHSEVWIDFACATIKLSVYVW